MAYSTIVKPQDYFNTKLYTGNGSAGNAITGVGFQSDFSWIKNRAADWHIWTDAVRGVTKQIYSNSSSAEATDSTYMQSFNSDGFTLGTNADVNDSGNNYASWNWLAANGTASNTTGSINSTVSVNTTSGFSIVTYTGTNGTETVGHGLGVVPKMIIIKYYTSGKDWVVYHEGLTSGASLTLNGTSAQTLASSKDYFNSTAPTSSVFTIKKDGVYDQVNNGTAGFIAYCFSDVQGFSKMGSYTGNGNADGTFVYTGFKPAFVMTKEWEGTSDWYMNDTTRDFNGTYGNDASLLANTSGAEFTSASLNVDMLSNGFKLRSTNASTNEVAGYIYMVFAAAPLVGSNNVPANAR